MGRCEGSFFAKCGCGEVLYSQTGKREDASWTKSILIISALDTSSLDEKDCPGCGGDASVPIGEYMHPRFLQSVETCA